MKLQEIIRDIAALKIVGTIDKEVKGINIDSRLVEEGHVFVAIRGTQTDGHAFIRKAIEKGATAVVCEEIPDDKTDDITYIQVADTEDIAGEIVTRFYGDPTGKIDLVGVTGTNGKTTVATLLYNLFRQLGYKVGLLSTVCNCIDGQTVPTDHTTPDPVTLNRLLEKMAEEGCKYVFMEVSSHAIAQKRIGGLKFAGGIFTNITRDHLDYHRTFENYLKAKKAFFDGLPSTAFALTNKDDKNGMVMVQNTKAKVYTYSVRGMGDFKGKVLEEGFDGMLLDFNRTEVDVRFIGRFNASNLLAVYGTACILGKKTEEVLLQLSTLHPVAGRMEPLYSRKGYIALVDYAHTPDALTNVLATIRDVLHGKGNVITVIGAGGNRDHGKRPMMAKEAVKQSDKVIITSDNPRSEDPQSSTICVRD